MNFHRKRIKGQNRKVRRTWLSDEGYRIIWRKDVCGVRVPARFQATVRTTLPNGQMWDSVGRRLFKTMIAAQEACEKHQVLWTKAVDASGVRQLEELFGKVPLGFPVWAKSKLNRKFYGLLMDTSTAKHEDDEPCEPLSPTDTDGHGDSAKAFHSAVAPVGPPGTEPEKPARTRTAKSSKPNGKRRKSTSHSKVTGATSSRCPRRKKPTCSER
jgi:hypothetical protein